MRVPPADGEDCVAVDEREVVVEEEVVRPFWGGGGGGGEEVEGGEGVGVEGWRVGGGGRGGGWGGGGVFVGEDEDVLVCPEKVWPKVVEGGPEGVG